MTSATNTCTFPSLVAGVVASGVRWCIVGNGTVDSGRGALEYGPTLRSTYVSFVRCDAKLNCGDVVVDGRRPSLLTWRRGDARNSRRQ